MPITFTMLTGDMAVIAEHFAPVPGPQGPRDADPDPDPGVDLTAYGPRSVSAVWVVAPPEVRRTIEKAQHTAVADLVGYMERHCPLVCDHGEARTAKGVVAAAFPHRPVRPTGATGPAFRREVHTHVLMPMVQRHDGAFCRPHRDQMVKHRRELEAAYHAALATALAQAGFPIERQTGPGARSFEVAGVPEQHLR